MPLYAITQVLALIGFAISLYFIMVYRGILSQNTRMLPKDICSPHTCGNIIATQYSYLFGIQNFVWGLLFYTLIFLAGFFQFGHTYLLLIMLATWVSVAYAAYLLHAMVYRIHIICNLGVATHIINLLIAILYTSLALT